MQYPLYNQKAENIGKVDLPDAIFNLAMNNDLVHQIITSLRSNKRQVIAHAKGRGEVRGGGKKPWKQKGTGRARHASIRSPIWKGGGVTFGPTKERNFKKKINKKMARRALFMVLSSKAKDKQLFVLDDVRLENPKTKEMAVIMKNLSSLMGNKPTVLLALPSMEDKIKRSSKNLPNFSAVEARNLNPLEILSYKYLVLAKDSVDALNKTFNK
ncbi:MAG: 50S ribosomal protein L4 [Candidatus Yanofskybacteria bacterium RIFCSPLOWO2_02_FULL_43_10]|uniref:Large ribosomal subunit protein uL4 n=1 Tax=Candidatus Yanofskybacteria bacterium RIFCSPLOWO2_12_FULL_43_11b TaxID=1802710 RepID=A0A1F8H820_9BACT|nr:MAG: 50S ribosomal protein L4 [Candidatus Yanofskybacteria bacterium RIFCSPHIGHO2_01_FULL_43_32]OGN12101.1 MAG: 50S ribosomal protein L4 [Candidatus Yanofskybacteria bacterium RIFCSPHIGHO2_02_FULL_43_12]OGN18288.1 MAG: 50S ribosomal protein L4 [Candidatus Yanofskybacteria bacterium RIFCSPHIGHO2_12_FULL_43_11]OGN25249.1 MAG: 50S ribosomal protein L4 [Candidatus Yanofskybacteria bacterium RIFCSPLOWO2_01_FULL_43_46]OGN30375.1 MAG: 50S ribosomal protein L4 [Candidatus Yanofskybacteria bacterium 